MKYCENVDFAGVYTCARNKVDLEQKNKDHYDYTGLMYASKHGHKSIVDLYIDF